MKNKVANAPITFEEIVMVMINTNTGRSVHTQIKRNDKTKSVLDISQRSISTVLVIKFLVSW